MIRRVPGVLLDPRFPLSRRELSALVDELAAALGLPAEGFSLELVDDAAMAGLNAAFLGLPGPTNVLSFPSEDGELVGDIALDVDALAREAFLYGQEPRGHLARLLAHAMLHAAGLDHGPEMESATEAALAAVGAA